MSRSFDALVDALLRQGKPRKREKLVTLVLERGDVQLRAAALQRRAAMQADRGDFTGAWATFVEAQRVQPGNPNLAHLEVTLHMAQGELTRARERARFWKQRLERQGDPRHDDLLQWLDGFARDPGEIMRESARATIPSFARFDQLLAMAPPPSAHYRLRDMQAIDDSENSAAGASAITELVASAALADVESRWRKVFTIDPPPLTQLNQESGGFVWHQAREWLGFIAREPLAWQSFEILDDLVMAPDSLPLLNARTHFAAPLNNRGLQLLDDCIGTGAVPQLHWAIINNRPALRMLARGVYDARAQGDTTRSTALAERLLTMNPRDNQGIREFLGGAYLAAGRADAALALAERFQDDFVTLTLHRILALYRLNRRGDALVALDQAASAYRVAIDMLLAANPRKPSQESFGITVGGKEEAWNYRDDFRALWAHDGALDWLGQAWRDLRGKPPKRR